MNYIVRSLHETISHKWKGWWYKAYLFSSHAKLHGVVLYLDLDSVICSSLDFLQPLIEEFQNSESNYQGKDQYAVADSLDMHNIRASTFSSIHFCCLGAEHMANEGMTRLEPLPAYQ